MKTLKDIDRRLTQIEAARAKVKSDLRRTIHAARAKPPMPTHTVAELKALAALDNAIGRIARGWLRIGFTSGSSTGNKRIDPAAALKAMAGYFYDKPLDFVLFA